MKKLQDDIVFGIGEEVSLKEGYYLIEIKAGDKGIVRDYKPQNASYLYLVNFGGKKGDSWLYAHHLEGKEEPNYKFELGDKVKCNSGEGKIIGRWDEWHSCIGNCYKIWLDHEGVSLNYAEYLLTKVGELTKPVSINPKKEHSCGEEVLIKTGKYSGRNGIIRGKSLNGIMEYYVEAHYPGRNPDGEDNIVLFSNDIEAIDKETEARGIRLGSDHELDENHYMLLRIISRNLKSDIFNDGLYELEQWGYVKNLGYNDGFYVLTEIGKQALKERE